MSKPRDHARARVVTLRLLGGLAVLAAGLALAACGSSSSDNGASAERSREHRQEVELADFAKCLREHGVNAESSTGPGGQGFALKVKGTRGGPDAGQQTMEAAQKDCQKYRPAPQKVNLSPQEKVEHEEAVLKYAKCMREHGINVHASAVGNGIKIGIHAGPGSGGPNPESPAFQSAQKACSGYLPFKGKGGPGSGRSEDGTASPGKPGGGKESGASLAIGG